MRLLHYFLCAGFVLAGVMHFVKPEPFLAIYPAAWPAAREAVYLSGLAEIAGAVGLAVPKTRYAAAIGLILLLVAVYPANINMAINASKFDQFPAWVLWLRLPLQFVLAWLVWKARR